MMDGYAFILTNATSSGSGSAAISGAATSGSAASSGSGSAASGSATSGSATSGCATSGSATSGSATSGSTTGSSSGAVITSGHSFAHFLAAALPPVKSSLRQPADGILVSAMSPLHVLQEPELDQMTTPLPHLQHLRSTFATVSL